jgi:hypothetical protein
VEVTVNCADDAVRKAAGVVTICVERYYFGLEFITNGKALNSSEEIRLCQTKNGSKNLKTAGM